MESSIATKIGRVLVVGGMSEVWGDAISANGAYALHIPQVVAFYLGLVLLRGGIEA